MNSYIKYLHNTFKKVNTKPMSRHQFMFLLHHELTKPWQVRIRTNSAEKRIEKKNWESFGSSSP